MRNRILILLLVASFGGPNCYAQYLNKSLIDTTSYTTYAKITAGDLDNDALIDIVVEHNGLSWLKNSGAGKFTRPISIDTTLASSAIQKIYTRDLDNNGKEDIITSHYYGGIRVNYGQGAGQFKESVFIAPVSQRCSEVCFIDFDFDGDLDLFYIGGQPGSGGSPEIGWIENLGKRKFSVKNVIESQNKVGWSYEGIECADIDNDGDIDIVATQNSIYYSNLGVVWFENKGHGFNPRQNIFIDQSSRIKNGHGYHHIHLNFYDNDDYIDIAVSGRDAAFWLKNMGQGKFQHRPLLESENNFFKPLSFDHNNDDMPDILVTTSKGSESHGYPRLILFENTGAASFNPILIDEIPFERPSDLFIELEGIDRKEYLRSIKVINYRPPLAVDIDNDGVKEIILLWPSQGIFIYGK